MPHSAAHRTEIVEQAAALARDVAPELGTVVLTHYPDADTLDTFRPGTEDLETTNAVTRAVAAALAGSGVQVLVQRADRASFRRWMDGRADTPQNRLAWRDRGRLLRGAAALEALGLDPKLARPRTEGIKPLGTPADRLVRAFAGEGNAAFEEVAEELLVSGRDGVIDLALRKAAERYDEEFVEALALELLVVAEGAEIGPSGWAELVALPVALPPDPLPDAAALGQGLVAAGILPDTLELRFLPGWRSPEALAGLHPGALRRVLVAMVAGQEPAELPPVTPEDLAEQGFGVLLGLQIDWGTPAWEDIAANGLPDEPEEDLEEEAEDGPEAAEQSPEEAARAAVFDRWRTAVFEVTAGCVPLALVPPSEVEAEIADFLEEARGQTGGIEEIREFVAVAQREAGGEEVVCRPEVIGDELELSLYTQAGRFLDSLRLTAEQMPAGAAEMPRLIAAFVPLVKDTPGR